VPRLPLRLSTVIAAALCLQACALTPFVRRLGPDPGRPGRQPATRRQLVLSQAMPARAGGPVFVALDSGMEYRLEPADGSVRVSPRVAHLPPPREVGSLYGGGAVFVPRVTGEYRLDTDAPEEGVVEVRLWREEGDEAERRCVSASLGSGCVGQAWAHGRRPLGFWLTFVAVPLAVAGLTGHHLGRW
jgi:hypothetical protein